MHWSALRAHNKCYLLHTNITNCQGDICPWHSWADDQARSQPCTEGGSVLSGGMSYRATEKMRKVQKKYFGHWFQSAVWALMTTLCYALHWYCFLLPCTIQHWLFFWSLPWPAAACLACIYSGHVILAGSFRGFSRAPQTPPGYGPDDLQYFPAHSRQYSSCLPHFLLFGFMSMTTHTSGRARKTGKDKCVAGATTVQWLLSLCVKAVKMISYNTKQES